MVPHRGYQHEVGDPFGGMLFGGMPEDLGRGGSGFGGMFDSMLQGMQRSFGEMERQMERAFEEAAAQSRDGRDGRGGGTTYFYESMTRSVGPDGKVREERVRTKPGRDGRPETKRVVRDESGREHVTRTEGEIPRFGEFARDFGRIGGYGHEGYNRLPDPVLVEEVHDDDEDHGRHGARRTHSRRRSRRCEGEPIVEEPDDSSGVVSDHGSDEHRGIRHRMRAWRNRF